MERPVQYNGSKDAEVAVAVVSFGSRMSGFVLAFPVQFVTEAPPPPPVLVETVNLERERLHVPVPAYRAIWM